MAIRYLVTLEYSDYSDSGSNFEFEGKIKIIAVTLCMPWRQSVFVNAQLLSYTTGPSVIELLGTTRLALYIV
jgi:hypothetical protein